MASSTIPLIPDAHYEFSTTLENVQFTFVVRWNSRDNDGAGAYYLDMFDADGLMMFAGEKLALGTYIGRKSAHPWFSENVLVMIDTTLAEQDAGFDELGKRILLQHYPLTSLLTLFVS